MSVCNIAPARRTHGARRLGIDGRTVAVGVVPGHWGVPPQAWAPEGRLLSEEAIGVIEREIERLPPAQRAVITMRDVQGFTSEEVCNALDLTETNQRVLLHRARAKVRDALEEYMR